jgi:hypothetical protein
MWSTTGQVVHPAGERCLPFNLNTSTVSISIPCQHTLAIQSSIFSPAATCAALDYYTYQLTFDRRHGTSAVLFGKAGAPDITINWKYIHRKPFIQIPPDLLHSLQPAIPRLLDPLPSARLPERLDRDQATAIDQVLRLSSLEKIQPTPSPADCGAAIFHLILEKISYGWTYGGRPVPSHPSRLGCCKSYSVAHAHVPPELSMSRVAFQDRQGPA